VYNYLGFLGLFGFLLTSFESFVIFREYQSFANATPGHTLRIVLYYLGFVLFNFFGYSIIPFFVKWYGATLLNISNLTTIIWSMLSDILLFDRPFVIPIHYNLDVFSSCCTWLGSCSR
jgi:Solute carrier family 35